MLISVVIPTYNRRGSLVRCLRSLFAQTIAADQFEIVVVADGCTDDTIMQVRQLNAPCAVRVLEQLNRGQGAARNAGIRAATGKYILLLDDDFVCDTVLLEEHARAHRFEGAVVFGPILHDGSAGLPAVAIDREIRSYYEGDRWRVERPPWLPPNSSVERHILLSSGGYNEDLSRAREDTELGLRLQDMGAIFEFAPKASVRQTISKTASDIVRDAAGFGANDVRLLRIRPDYLRFCNLSQISSGSRWKRIARRLVATAPLCGEPLLRPLYLLADSRLRAAREFGIRILNLRRYIVWLRAAVGEAGGWTQLQLIIGNSRLRAKGQAQ